MAETSSLQPAEQEDATVAAGAAAIDAVSASLTSTSTAWDPANCPQWDMASPSEQCFMRIKRDMMTRAD